METKEMDLFLGLGFVDRILELGGSRIVAQKNLTITEDFLLDHFPNYPVMPGVLMTQAVVETAGWWLKHKMDFKVSGIRLKEARNIRYANFLTPGQILTIEVENQSIGEGVAEFQGKGRREESVVLSLKFTVNYDLLKGVASPRDCACYEANERESFHHLYKNSSAL